MTKLTIFVAPAVSEDEDSDITLQEISLDSALELDRNGEIPKETAGYQHAKGNLSSDPVFVLLQCSGKGNMKTGFN